MNSSILFASKTLEDSLRSACKNHYNRIAVTQGDDFYTYEELLSEVTSFKEWLSSTIGRKTVLIKMDNTINNLFLLIGSILSEAVPLFYDPVWKSTELKKAIDLNACSYILADDVIDLDIDEVVVIGTFKNFRLIKIFSGVEERTVNLLPNTSFCRFTSGSTGFSRCLQFTQQAFLNAGYNWSLSAQYQPTDKIYCVATLNNGLAFINRLVI